MARFACLVALVVQAGVAAAQGEVVLPHVHGLAYSSDGKRLMVPSHHGLALYEKGRWSRGPGPAHDYMGFVATAKGLYSSGHPVPGSGLVNPFGLMRSEDGGRTWRKLGLEGESDFHLLAASWNAGAVYVWNEERNSRMPRAGLYLTRDDGGAWKAARSSGLRGKKIAIAAHPNDAAMVALATSDGVFLSRDAGESFFALTTVQGTAVYFDLDGRQLWYGAFAGRPLLRRAPLAAAGEAQELPLPPLTGDAVSFVAQNPTSRSQYAIATYQRNVYVSADAGRSWTQIAEYGTAR